MLFTRNLFSILFRFVFLSSVTYGNGSPSGFIPLPHRTCFLSGSTTRYPVRSNLKHLHHKATANCCQWGETLLTTHSLKSAFFLSSLFNSVCRLLKAIWAGPGKHSVAVVLTFYKVMLRLPAVSKITLWPGPPALSLSIVLKWFEAWIT